jgi:hypothetical protein
LECVVDGRQVGLQIEYTAEIEQSPGRRGDPKSIEQPKVVVPG